MNGRGQQMDSVTKISCELAATEVIDMMCYIYYFKTCMT